MNRRTIRRLTISLLLFTSVLFGVDRASAQEKTVKDQLVGAWTLVSSEVVEPNGARRPLVKGPNVKGLMILTADGKVSFQVIGDHPMIASNDRSEMTSDEIKDTAESILSFFGTYTVNEAEKGFTMQIERSSFPNQTASPARRMVEFTGEEMKVTNPVRLGGGQVTLVWKRAK